MLKIGMIVGSTRPNRFADTPAKWLLDGAAARIDRRPGGAKWPCKAVFPARGRGLPAPVPAF